MRIHNIFVDDKGETHFRDIQVEWKHEGRGGKTSDTFPATGIIFRQTPGTYDYEWHPAPRRQYIINLDGGVSIQASDGETRIIGAAQVLLVVDSSRRLFRVRGAIRCWSPSSRRREGRRVDGGRRPAGHVRRSLAAPSRR